MYKSTVSETSASARVEKTLIIFSLLKVLFLTLASLALIYIHIFTYLKKSIKEYRVLREPLLILFGFLKCKGWTLAHPCIPCTFWFLTTGYG